LTSAKLVKSQLDYGEQETYIFEAPFFLIVSKSFVSVHEDIVVHSDDFEFRRKVLEILKEEFPGLLQLAGIPVE
jgi:hypothetical protein